VLLEAELDVDAAPADAWAALTSPALRADWEGAISVDGEGGVAHGLGATTRCVTGRLATIEEVVDWQPFEHVGWRVTVAGLGPVAATADLEPRAGAPGTHVRFRWSALGESVDEAVAAEFSAAKRSALGRLERSLDRVDRMGRVAGAVAS
jgi:hypothetical protein